MRIGLAAMVFLLATSLLRADRLADITRLHLEVTGGAGPVAALAAIRAQGVIFLEGLRVRFVLTAARPNRLRLETEAEGQKQVLAYDGIEHPWEFDANAWPPRIRILSEPNASRIVADAEYDGALTGGSARGFRLEFSGEVERDGRNYLRLLVAYKFIETYTLLLDPETCLIAYRIDTQSNASGETVDTVTQYESYQPVDGVLLPHEIITSVNGVVTERMRIDQIEANPALSDDMFAPPDLPSSAVQRN